MKAINVLVVDDDLAVCRIVHRMLCDEQHTIQTSQSVSDALEAVAQKSFDVYVVDCKLLDGSGLEVVERIRSKESAAPIILISGYNQSVVEKRKAEKLCISEFIQKPFSRETICNAVKKAIGSPPEATASADSIPRKDVSPSRTRSSTGILANLRHLAFFATRARN